MTVVKSELERMTVFNKNKVNTKKQPMFFGQPLGVQRYDEYKYPVFDRLTQQQLGYFWRPEEVSLQKDEVITKLYRQSKSISSLVTLNTKSCWILYKGVVFWHGFLSHTVHYLNLEALHECMGVYGDDS